MKYLRNLLLFAIALYVLACAALYLGQEVIIFHPYELPDEHEFTFARPFEELDIEMSDGTELNAIHFTLNRPKGIVLFWHGNTGNVEVCSPIVKHFMSRRYATLIVDYRGYGNSEGERTQENMYSDALEVFDYLRARYPKKKIVIYGQSLGTGVSTYTAAHRDAHHLLLEAPYYSIEAVGKRNFSFMPVSSLIRFPMRSHEYIDSVSCPITVLHGTDDQTIPHEHGQKLCSENPRCEFISLAGGGHNSCPLFQEYQDALDMALLGYVRADQTEVVIPELAHEPEELISDSLMIDSNRNLKENRPDSTFGELLDTLIRQGVESRSDSLVMDTLFIDK